MQQPLCNILIHCGITRWRLCEIVFIVLFGSRTDKQLLPARRLKVGTEM